MNAYLARDIKATQQVQQSEEAPFGKTSPRCVYCKGITRMAFVAHEGEDAWERDICVCDLVANKSGKDGDWLTRPYAVTVHFCQTCLKPTVVPKSWLNDPTDTIQPTDMALLGGPLDVHLFYAAGNNHDLNQFEEMMICAHCGSAARMAFAVFDGCYPCEYRHNLHFVQDRYVTYDNRSF